MKQQEALPPEDADIEIAPEEAAEDFDTADLDAQLPESAASPPGTSLITSGAASLDAYVRSIGQVPMLEAEDERNLARRLRDYGDIEAARKLVLSHLRLVVSIARGYLGYGLPLADLVQEGNIGLMKAVKHFDPEIGGRLASFAVHWIKSEIHDYVIRNWRVVKVATTKAQRKLFFKLRQNKKHLGWFTENERAAVASDLGVSSQDVAEMETRLAGQDVGFDLENDDSHTSAGLLAPAAYLADENSDFARSFENIDYENFELRQLHKALAQLDERSRHVVQRRWLDEHKATLSDLSQELGVSMERVRQIENAALKRIKLDLKSADEALPAPQAGRAAAKPESQTAAGAKSGKSAKSPQKRKSSKSSKNSKNSKNSKKAVRTAQSDAYAEDPEN